MKIRMAKIMVNVFILFNFYSRAVSFSDVLSYGLGGFIVSTVIKTAVDRGISKYTHTQLPSFHPPVYTSLKIENDLILVIIIALLAESSDEKISVEKKCTNAFLHVVGGIISAYGDDLLRFIEIEKSSYYFLRRKISNNAAKTVSKIVYSGSQNIVSILFFYLTGHPWYYGVRGASF